jgi:hypothetical protein
MNFAMATLGLKEMGKFLWEGREKSVLKYGVKVTMYRPPKQTNKIQIVNKHSYLIIKSCQ